MSYKIIITIVVLLVVPFLTYVGYNRLIERDFNAICEEYQRASQNPVEDRIQQESELSKNISKRTYMPSVKMALSAVGGVSPKRRYKILLSTAKGLGYDSWSCVEIEEYLLQAK